MTPPPLGTILPTPADLKAADAHAEKMARCRDEFGRKNLAGLSRRVVGREVRYYDGGRFYAVVNDELKLRWFEVRADGEYAVTR